MLKVDFIFLRSEIVKLIITQVTQNDWCMQSLSKPVWYDQHEPSALSPCNLFLTHVAISSAMLAKVASAH